MVQLEHPRLPGRVIDVKEAAVHHHERSGWRRRLVDLTPESGDAETVNDEAAEHAEIAASFLGFTETR